MNKINPDALLEKIIEDNKKNGVKPTLLLHSCCAPCSSACIERLFDAFDITVFYYNPNIDTDFEYEKRANEQLRFCNGLNVKTIIKEHCKEDFYSAVKGLENCKEGGERCSACFKLRLEKTARTAKEKGFDYFATTLTVSPLKNATVINSIGEETGDKYGVLYLATDFKKRNGYARSVELSKEYGLYRQNYCGCEFSKRETT